MATRKQPIPDLPELPADFQYVIDSESLAAMREALGITDEADTTVHVYRIDSDTKVEAKIWDGDAGSFNLTSLAQTFGSGQYRVKVYARNETGQKPCRYNRVQAMELSADDESRVQRAKYAARHPELNANSPAHHNGVDMHETISAMMAGFQATVAQMITAMKPAAPVDSLAQLQQMAAVMKTLMPAAAAPTSGPDAMTQFSTMLGMMKSIKEIAGNDVPAEASASERLLLKAADAFMPAVAAGLNRQASPAPAADASAESERPALAAPVAASDELSEDEQMKSIKEQARIALFQLMLQGANKAAARGVSAAEYADKIYDDFEESDIHTLALKSNWFALMCEAVPGCKVHEAWYQAVRAEIVRMALEDELLARDAAGNLTLPDDSGTVIDDTGGKDGTIDDAAGNTAGEAGK